MRIAIANAPVTSVVVVLFAGKRIGCRYAYAGQRNRACLHRPFDRSANGSRGSLRSLQLLQEPVPQPCLRPQADTGPDTHGHTQHRTSNQSPHKNLAKIHQEHQSFVWSSNLRRRNRICRGSRACFSRAPSSLAHRRRIHHCELRRQNTPFFKAPGPTTVSPTFTSASVMLSDPAATSGRPPVAPTGPLPLIIDAIPRPPRLNESLRPPRSPGSRRRAASR